jgi:type I restriction enzyme, S subunit
VRELPNGWVSCPVEAIAAPEDNSIKRGPFGSALKKEFFVPQGYKVYEQKNAIYNDCELGNYYIDEVKFNELIDFSVQPGDFIISCSGTIGRISVMPSHAKPGVINQALLKISFNCDLVHSGFISHFLQSDTFQKILTGNSRGSAMQNISSVKELRAAEIPLPPLNEQKRIAQRLDHLLTRIDKAKAHLDRIPPLLKRFRQSVLAAATSGKLTEDWREANGVDDEWEEVLIGDLLEAKPRNGYSPKAVEFETQTKSLTLTATTRGIFDPKHFKYLDEIIPSDSYLWLCPGDILVQRANTLEYVGVCAIYDRGFGEFIYPDLMMKCRANEKVISKFLYYLLSSDNVRSYFRENATGTAGNMPKINQQTVISAPTAYPALLEQHEIVRRVETLFAKADRIEAQYQKARQAVDRLTPALLAKAFRGELVPQDPNDEPASVLLERIRAEKEMRRARSKKT